MSTLCKQTYSLLTFLILFVVSQDANAVTKTIDLVFGSNINNPTSGSECNFAVKTDCDLWHAQIEWDQDTDNFDVLELNELTASSFYGEFMPSISMIDQVEGEFVVNYTRWHDYNDEYLNFSIATIEVDLGNNPPVDLVETISHARFGDLGAEGGYLAWTSLDASSNPNVERASLDVGYATETPYTRFSGTNKCPDEANDPAFLGPYSIYLVYHCTGENNAKLTQKVKTAVFDRTANDVEDGCGHFATTYDTDWAICSHGGDLFYYDVTAEGGPKYLNTAGLEHSLVDEGPGDYTWDGSNCPDASFRQIFPNYGNSSNEMVYTICCTQDNINASDIIIAYADPGNGDVEQEDQYNLGGVLRNYLEAESIVVNADYVDFFTADMYIE